MFLTHDAGFCARARVRTFSGSHRMAVPLALLAVLSISTMPAFAVEFSVVADGTCSTPLVSAGGRVALSANPPTGSANFCICVCDGDDPCEPDPGTCTGIICADVDVSKVTLQEGAGCTGDGSVVVTLCDGDCTNPIDVSGVLLTAVQQCDMASGLHQVFVETVAHGDILLDVVSAKPVPEFCPVPAVSEWGLGLLVLLMLVAGSVVLRSRTQMAA